MVLWPRIKILWVMKYLSKNVKDLLWLIAMCKQVVGFHDTLTIEALVVLWRTRFAKNIGLLVFGIETNNLHMVNVIAMSYMYHAWNGSVFMEIEYVMRVLSTVHVQQVKGDDNKVAHYN
jgi:hypothetical protein